MKNENIRFKLNSRDDDKDKDKDKDKGPTIVAGFTVAPKEPPASNCNDVVATAGELIENLGNVRSTVAASIQVTMW